MELHIFIAEKIIKHILIRRDVNNNVPSFLACSLCRSNECYHFYIQLCGSFFLSANAFCAKVKDFISRTKGCEIDRVFSWAVKVILLVVYVLCAVLEIRTKLQFLASPIPIWWLLSLMFFMRLSWGRKPRAVYKFKLHAWSWLTFQMKNTIMSNATTWQSFGGINSEWIWSYGANDRCGDCFNTKLQSASVNKTFRWIIINGKTLFLQVTSLSNAAQTSTHLDFSTKPRLSSKCFFLEITNLT